MACNRITAAITAVDGRRAAGQGGRSTRTTRGLDHARPLQHIERRRCARPTLDRCHVNWVVCDSDWEAEFCRVAEAHPRVRAYVKNHNLGFEVPYGSARRRRTTCPTSSCWSTTATATTTCCTSSSRSRATGARTPRRREHDGHLLGAGRQQLGTYGRWAFAEFTDVYQIEAEFEALIEGVRRESDVTAHRLTKRDGKSSWPGSQAKTPPARSAYKDVESSRHRRRDRREEHSDRRVPVGIREGQPDPRGLRAPQPRPRPATRLARQGRAGLERPRRPRAAALHPGEGPPEGADRRPAAAEPRAREHEAGRAARPLRRLQRPARRSATRPSSTSTTRTGRTA